MSFDTAPKIHCIYQPRKRCLGRPLQRQNKNCNNHNRITRPNIGNDDNGSGCGGD
jgi:hypothetical protein